jgi:hypothetical protein
MGNQIIMCLDALQAKLDALKRHQTETAAKLDALLPAVQDPGLAGRALNRANSTELAIKY